MSRNSLVSAFESIARGPVGRTVENGLRKVGLYRLVHRPYNHAISSLVVRNGEYPIEVGDSTASIIVRNRDEYWRVKSMFEEDVLSSVLADLETGDVFYDVGANIGVYSCLVGDVLPGESIVAFEPHPTNEQVLQENLQRNEVDATVFQQALSDEDGEVSLAVAVESHTTSPGHNLIEVNDSVKKYGEDGAEKVRTEMSRGDGLIDQQGLPAPTVLKIDVEGAELDVLRGLEDTLRNHCRVVYCEVHRNHIRRFGGSDAELRNFLETCGFTLEALNDNKSKYHLRATK